MTYFTRLPTQEGSRRCFTLAIWIKRSRVNRNFSNGTSLAIQGIFSGTSGTTFFRFNDDGNGDEMRFLKGLTHQMVQEPKALITHQQEEILVTGHIICGLLILVYKVVIMKMIGINIM